MNYFSKIEAYFADEMTAVEKTVFEQELAENNHLQQEWKAYQTAQQLFGLVASNLPESDIIVDTARETTEQIITFTANALSEKEILEPITPKTQKPVIRKLQRKSNRTAW